MPTTDCSQVNIFQEWCEVFSLCNFLEFSLGEEVILDRISQISILDFPALFLTMTDKNHYKYLDIWEALVQNSLIRVSEIENELSWNLKEEYDCYDSLKPGQGPRSLNDIYQCCCKHYSAQKGIYYYDRDPTEN